MISRRAFLQATLAAPAAGAAVLGQGPSPSQGATARFVQKPKPLSPGAVTHDWKSFLGPTHNAVSTETRLSRKLPPPLVWEIQKGTGYSSPSVSGQRLVFLHRSGDRELIECVNSETGLKNWQFSYDTNFEDRYGYNNGPRSSPVIDDDRVYVVSALGVLHCLDLAAGKVFWRRDFRVDYKIHQDFFGMASTPLIEGSLLIVNVGAPGGPCVVALDKATGREVWRAGKEWGPSYASPVPAVVHGKRRVFVFAGGESDPPAGGLMCIDPSNGHVDFSFPWRSRSVESVNASCPVVFDNKVFISASYRTGGALLEILPDFTSKVLWKAADFGLHFNTPIYKDGYLYGFDGRNEPDAALACLNVSDGKVVWREDSDWVENVEVRGEKRQQSVATYRGTLISVDGNYLCLGELGHLFWLDLTPRGYKQVSRTWLFAARESWTPPVLSRGLLYVMQNTRDVLNGAAPRLLCYDLRA